ncbi:bifunctional phosphoribosyl-AMP cyclohydrolase phosphoribosyl-ATP pyrophosphatase [Pycnococcus provasolii]
MLVAIAQDADTGMILMQAFANKDAVMNTVTSRKATWYSRSRDKLWIKGEESGNFIEVTSVYADCDGDSVIYLGKPRGPSCHTGAQTCYYTQLDGPDGAIANNQVKEHKKDFAHTHEHGAGAAPTATPTLLALQRTIADRANEPVVEGTKPSWTRRLLSNHELLCSKVREEADELCQALEKNEGVERATSEFGDVLYHSLVLLHAAGGDVNDALATLRARFNQSGVEEKASRK